MQLINYVKQRAEILCRGKWRSSVDESSKIQCLDGITGTDPIQAKTGWTYIVKNHDVQVKDMNSFNEGNYDIFVYSWNLIIKQVTTDLKVFKNNWFISEMLYDEFSWVKLILNDPYWLYTWDEVVAWKFIKGNFIVDGSVRSSDWSGFDNVYFVYWKMTTKDSVDQLGRVFKRRCKMWIQGTDGTPCPGSEKAQDGTISWINPYENASLVIIDQNYPSPLYQ